MCHCTDSTLILKHARPGYKGSKLAKEKSKSLNESGIALFCLPNKSTFMNSTYSLVLVLFSCAIGC